MFGLQLTVRSYTAYGDGFKAWFGQPSAQVGAAIDVRTNLPGRDPNDPGTNYRWIQVVTTNSPLGANAGNSALPLFVDNASTPGQPYYTAGVDGQSFTLDQSGFVDVATRTNFLNPITFKAETFLAKRISDRSLIIYPEGFTWGWSTQTRTSGNIPTAFSGSATPNVIPWEPAGGMTNLTASLVGFAFSSSARVAFIDTTDNNKLLGPQSPVLPTGQALQYAATLNNIQFTAGITATLPAPHTIRIVFSGDAFWTGSNTTTFISPTFVVTVNPPPRRGAMSLDSSANPATAGDTVTFTATMAAATGLDTPTGNVTFFNGATSLGTASLINGLASMILNNLPAGITHITAIYGGDSEYLCSTDEFDETGDGSNGSSGDQAETTTTLSSSAAEPVLGQTVTLSATVGAVGDATGTPSGTVTFYDGLTVLGTQTLDDSGNASIDVSTLAYGSHDIPPFIPAMTTSFPVRIR
jgi:Bacterial Ig-like domain (group 3)